MSKETVVQIVTAEEFIKAKMKKLEKQQAIAMKDIGRKGSRSYVIEQVTFLKAEELNEKIYCFERLRRHETTGELSYNPKWRKNNLHVYRLGYYIIGKNGNKLNRWTWGQYCPLITGKDLIKLLNKARREKTLLS